MSLQICTPQDEWTWRESYISIILSHYTTFWSQIRTPNSYNYILLNH